MQKLQKIIYAQKQNASFSDQQLINLIKEYLQVFILKSIYQSKYGKNLSFMGGTCLRICHDLKRYSEDLDFALDQKETDYSFKKLNHIITNSLKYSDFLVDSNIQEDKTVQKSFIRVQEVLHLFGFSNLKSQKIHIKIEVDTKPVMIKKSEVEPFFVTKFNEIYPILKHTDPTLFAGKIVAILNRPYTKGRDFYDLIWYLTHKTEINMEYLNRCFMHYNLNLKFNTPEEVLQYLQKVVNKTDTTKILKDVERFIEDEEEKNWIKNYPALFQQVSKKYLELYK